MKKLIGFFSLLIILFSTGCIKNTAAVNTDSKVEFDAATWNSNAVGVSYPILLQRPTLGAATPAPTPTFNDSISRRITTDIIVRVNLLGPQKNTLTTFNYRVVPAETNAIAGTHYTALSGTGTIPASSSFGFIDIKVLNSGIPSPTPAVIVLELLPNDVVATNINYAKVGFSISQL